MVGVAYLVGRILYAQFYVAYGPNMRIMGATLVDVSLVVLAGMALYGGWQLAGVSAAIAQ